MKIYKNGEIESIQINYTDGQSYAIWLPRQVDLVLGTIQYEEDNEDELRCEFQITGEADFKNINMVEDK